jgi:acyl transferase domain-containing protein/acyl carrier protein
MTIEKNGLEIAVIGISGRFPGGVTVDDFWENLKNGVELTSVFPSSKSQKIDVKSNGSKQPIKAGAVLDDVERFDASFFGFNPREAEVMDPQHRLFLECAWEALENAGYDSEREERPIGVYAGVGMSTYLLYNLSPNQELMESAGFLQTLIGVDKDYVPTRVSYKLNLKGPSVSVGTACSSSLVAVHLACQSLLSGECEMALAAGVSVKVPQNELTLSPEGIISPDGQCRAFDAKANGTIGGNGIGVVVLKRLEDAIADGDYIYAVIKGSTINNDGALKVGYTAPSEEGQVRVIQAAQVMAEVEPETITYMETHGTGTPLGDPIEIAAMTRAFRATTDKKGYCAIGSVKTNVGHLDAAAGIAGLIKTVLALHHKLLPPSLHFETPNPQIDFENSPFYVNTKLSEWKTNGTPRRAGVSSFGFGGTNAHVILEEAPPIEADLDPPQPPLTRGENSVKVPREIKGAASSDPSLFKGGENSVKVPREIKGVASSGFPLFKGDGRGISLGDLGGSGGLKIRPTPSKSQQLLVLSAKTSSALETATANLANYLEQRPDLNLADVAYTLQLGRRAFEYRRMVVAQDINDAVEALKSGDSQRVFTQFQKASNSPIAFMFPGQGAQYVNMALEVYHQERTFREQVDYCCQLLELHLGLDLRQLLYPNAEQTETARTKLEQTYLAQPALFVIEYALAKLWQSWGVQPVALIGHSIGEYVAACLAEVFSLEEALKLVVVRSQLMQQQPRGAMLAVSLSAAEVQPLLGQHLSLAANNALSLCVVSGSSEFVDELENQLKAKDVDCRRLHTSHAFHSEMMDSILASFREQVQKIDLKAPQIPFVSNVSGKWITAAEATDPSYWVKHLRQTVRFSEGLAELIKKSQPILLEVGPGRTLSTLAKQQLGATEQQIVLTSLPHPRDRQSSEAFLLTTLGRLWLAGVQINWSEFSAGERRHRLPLPTYPFERQRYWIEAPQQTNGHFKPEPTAPLLLPSLVEAGRIQSQQGIEEFDAPTYLAKQQSLECLCVAYINLTLRRLGAFSNPGETYSQQTLFNQLHIEPQHQPLLSRWLKILVNQGQLEQHGETFTNLKQLSTESFNVLVEEAKATFADTPQWLEFIQSCGENLAPALLGKKKQLELLFPGGSLETIEQFFKDAPLFSYYSALAQKTLQQLAQSLNKDVNLRILEIGAGTGVVTEGLLPVVRPGQTTYTFADANSFSLNRAKQKFGKYPFVQYRLLDIEEEPQNQGYELHSFDVVIAHNVLHSTKNLRKALRHTRSLLAPGGILLLWELTAPQSMIFELVFSPITRTFEDEDPRQDYPFLSKEQWQQELQNHGFVEVEVIPTHPASEQHILVAQAASTEATTSKAFTQLCFLPEPQKTIHTLQASSAKKPNIADWFYIPAWKQSMPPQLFQRADLAEQKSRWLVFVDDCGLGEQIVKRLEQERQEVLKVIVGEKFDRISEGVHTINPQQRQDYDALFAELVTHNQIPQIIAHLWSITPNVSQKEPSGSTQTSVETEFFEKSQAKGFYSLLYLAQAVGTQNLTDSIQIGVISNHLHEVTGSEVLIPEKATVLGPVRVIPLEHPNISCRCIDVLLPESGNSSEQLINQLIAELTISSSNSVVAYRGKHRWVQTFEPVRLEAKTGHNTVRLTSPPAPLLQGEGSRTPPFPCREGGLGGLGLPYPNSIETGQTPQLRQGGVYLITGGLGGIGLVIAEYLARTVKAKLILSGRSEFPCRSQWEQWLATHEQHDQVSEKIRGVKALEALGAEVLVVSADVTNIEQMQAVVNQAHEKFGQIHGVIHTAGVAGGGAIQRKTPEIVESVMAPKVKGVLVLESIFKDMHLDFLVLFSSLVGLLGRFGQVDYCAANAFLDAFAHSCASPDKTYTVSINWDAWQEVGMAAKATLPDEFKQAHEESLKNSIASQEGTDAFNRILNYQLPQVLVSTKDLEVAIKEQHSAGNVTESTNASSHKQAHSRPNLENAYVAPRNDVEYTLTTIWQNLLGIEKVGVHDNFFELGGHSLLATRLLKQLGDTFQIELPLQSLFEFPTVETLSRTLIANETQPGKTEKIARVIKRLKEMSAKETTHPTS